MRVLLTSVVIPLLAGLTALASPVYESSCNTSGPTASCFVNVTAALAANPSTYSDVHVVQTTKLSQPSIASNSLYGPAISAVSQVQFAETLTTNGPVREGYLQIDLTSKNLGDPSNGPGSGTFSFSLQPNKYQCGISDYPCDSTQGIFLVPLGTTFTLNYSGLLQSYLGGTADGNGSGTVDSNLQFRFLEADGTTPVAVSAVPEPATFVVLAGAFFLLYLVTQQRSGNRTT